MCRSVSAAMRNASSRAMTTKPMAKGVIDPASDSWAWSAVISSGSCGDNIGVAGPQSDVWGMGWAEDEREAGQRHASLDPCGDEGARVSTGSGARVGDRRRGALASEVGEMHLRHGLGPGLRRVRVAGRDPGGRD